MRFTDEPAPRYGAFPMSTLQVFSVRVEGIRRGLRWLIDVFGIVAARDTVDFNRNVIFSRTRDNCQTLTKEVPFARLTHAELPRFVLMDCVLLYQCSFS
jgi:hypothetical protein